MQIEINEERMQQIQAKALRCIATHGTLRWCEATICGCMGCANHFMTKDEYHIALKIKAVQDALQRTEGRGFGRAFRLSDWYGSKSS